MPRPKDERTPLDILAEIENNVKGLKKVLEGDQGLYEMNMALAMAEELARSSGRLSKRISKLLRLEIFERGNDNDGDNTKFDRKTIIRVKHDPSKIKRVPRT